MKYWTIKRVKLYEVSLPTRERGLKYAECKQHEDEKQSLPTRERGLKWLSRVINRVDHIVAPHAGAWIEIPKTRPCSRVLPVAPHAGAWIEISA